MAGIYPDDAEYREYWKGQKRRASARANASISPIFVSARDRITTNVLEVVNNRRYLKIEDPRRRMARVKQDPKMREIESIIVAANDRSLISLYANQEPHYKEEVPMVCKHLYPWWPGDCTADPLTKTELNTLKFTPFMGNTWREWIKINQNDALKVWRSSFRSIMGGDIRSTNAVSRDVQLVQSARSIINTNESRNITIFENAMIEVSRKVQLDVEAAIWP